MAQIKTATTTAPIDSAAVSPFARKVPPFDQKLADTAPVTLFSRLALKIWSLWYFVALEPTNMQQKRWL